MKNQSKLFQRDFTLVVIGQIISCVWKCDFYDLRCHSIC